MDSITAMCKEISQGLSLLSGNDADFSSDIISQKSYPIGSLSKNLSIYIHPFHIKFFFPQIVQLVQAPL